MGNFYQTMNVKEHIKENGVTEEKYNALLDFIKEFLSLSNKQTIIAICGKSASGKDTFAQQLVEDLNGHFLVNYTSRPPREREDESIHRDKGEFIGTSAGDFIDSSHFRGWHYGHRKEDIGDGINIGVFDNEELKKLLFSWGILYDIMPIYLDVPWKERLRRMVNREGKFKFEYVRRLLAERKQYKGFDSLLNRFVYSTVIKND